MFGGASCGTGINCRMSNAEVGNLPRILSSAIIPILFCSDCFVGVVAVIAVCSACCFRKGFGLGRRLAGGRGGNEKVTSVVLIVLWTARLLRPSFTFGVRFVSLASGDVRASLLDGAL